MEPDPDHTGGGKPSAESQFLPARRGVRSKLAETKAGDAMAAPHEFTIQLNGESYSLCGYVTIGALTDRLKLKRGRVAIELNHAVVPKAEWDSVAFHPGDKVEIVNFVGGG